MAEKRYSIPQGRLHIHGWRGDLMDAAAQLGTELIRTGARPRHEVDFEGARVFLKGAPLASGPATRHGLRRLVLRAHAPRISEYNNLWWLHNRLFETPVALAAGVLVRAGRPRYQFLLTVVEAAQPFEDVFPQETPSAQRAVMVELGREVARFHALHFVHRDLYPRNLLLRPAGSMRRVVFLDTWAGGPTPGRRGPAYDLACLFLEGARDFQAEHQAAFLESYFDERRRQAQPAAPQQLLRRAQSARNRLWRQLDREPGRRRGRDLPPATWDPPKVTPAS